MDQIFREDIVWLDQEFESQESFYREIADRLYKKGLVKETFGQALIDREAVFPTGLKTETCAPRPSFLPKACAISIPLPTTTTSISFEGRFRNISRT